MKNVIHSPRLLICIINVLLPSILLAQPFSAQNVIIEFNTSNPTSIYAADLDADGGVDVLSASEEDDKIAWYENDDHQKLSSGEVISG